MDPPWISAAEAAARLGVALPTLYAYVSRGKVRSAPGAGPHERRYSRADVEGLVRQKEGRRDPERLVRGALDFGAPVLETGISTIRDGRLWYRGQDAEALCRTQPFEAVAHLLWTGALGPLPAAAPPPEALAAALASGLPPLRAMTVGMAAWRDLGADGDDTVEGARILALLRAVAAGRAEGAAGGTLGSAKRLADAWGAPAAAGLLDAALVLCADHELNVSTFAARCVASAGSPLPLAVVAGLAALEGHRHGGCSGRVEALCTEIDADGVGRVLAGRRERGEDVPGFGHRLYPEGDPRGRVLLTLLSDAGRLDPLVAALVAAMAPAAPTVDVGLVALRRSLRLPPGSATVLFALGRSAGWIAHAREQAPRGLLRPRATYVEG